MKFSWNTNGKPWEFCHIGKRFRRTLLVEWDDGSGELIFVSVIPQYDGNKGKTLINFGNANGALNTISHLTYPDVLIKDLDFFAPYVAYFEMRHWQVQQRIAASYKF